VPVRAFSAFGNDHFLHGRPYVASVGLYDHRARFYEARTGTFLEPDPLGPVDSPNLYAAFSFDALSVTDPWGLAGDYNYSVFDSAGKVTKPLVLVTPIAPFKPVEVPQLAEVEFWYDLPEGGYVGLTQTGALVDARGRLLPLAQQARLLSQHPFLQGPDNPGLAQLIRSPQLVKYSEQELLRIWLEWANLSLSLTSFGSGTATIYAAGLRQLATAKRLYEVAERAGAAAFVLSEAKHLAEGNPKGLAMDAAAYVIPEVPKRVLKEIKKITELERLVLLPLMDRINTVLQRGLADELAVAQQKENGTQSKPKRP
jgi:RHS repeat-associated protein